MEKQDNFNRVIAILIAFVTLFAAVLAYLQSDAGGRDAQANRDSIRYALEAFGQNVSGNARVNFDYNTAYQSNYEYQVLSSSAKNREDAKAEKRFETMASETTKLSPLLSDAYKGKDGTPQTLKYEADVYLVNVTELMEKYTAASSVKEAWDYKANTYIIHITLLAVALFLFGLSATIASPVTRWVFSISGAGFTLVAIVWAGILYAQPVFDLRAQGSAIKNYSQGVGLAYQEKYDEAIAAFDLALKDYPQYANAFAERGQAKMALEKYDLAAADFKSAMAAGDSRANTAGQLAYAYYLQGMFKEAAEMDQQGIKASPDELWLQYDFGLSLLASGKTDEAQKVYQQAMDAATAMVAKAKEAGGEPPSYIWSAMEDSANSLDNLIYVIDSGQGKPAKEKISEPEKVAQIADELVKKLKSLSLALEYSGKPPQAGLTAKLTPFTFAEPTKDENGEVTGYQEPAVEFANGIDEFAVGFDYEGMKNDSEIIFKLYVNGEEDPSWRLVEKWSLGPSGSAQIPIGYAYSDTFTFAPGEYTVEVYVDYQLAQRGSFTINP
jgi:tetratricopeptide (TPR) repeat protein